MNGTNGDTDATGSAFWVSESTFTPVGGVSPTLPADVYSTGDIGDVSADANFSALLSSTTIPSNLAITPNTTYYFTAWVEVAGTWYPGAVLNFTTEAIDTTPDAFSFTDQTDVALSTTVESNEITVAGINTAADISVTGGEYSINSGAYTSVDGTIDDGDTVKVRHTSSASNSTSVDTVLTIDTVSDTFTSTTVTAGVDTTPDAFSFTDQTDVSLSVVVESNEITVAGIDSAASIIITGGEYSVNGGAYTSASGTINNGNTVKVRHTSSATVNTSTDTMLTIGGVSDTFTSTTELVDATPDVFAFTDQTGVALNTVIESNIITVSGLSAAAAITITGGEYSVNGGAYTSSAGTINNGNTVRVRHTSSSSNATVVNTVLTIGGVLDTFTSTTVAASSGGGGGGSSGSSNLRTEIAGCDTRTTGFSTISGRSCSRNIPHGEVLGASIGPIPGCDTRTTGFSTLTGQSCLTNLPIGAILGCDMRTTGFSTITGQSCLTNVPHGQVLGAGTYFFTLFLKAGPPYPLSLMIEVMELQKLLNLRGFNSGVVDGKFGPITKGAVIRFQIANGLVADGIVGPMTRAVLNR